MLSAGEKGKEKVGHEWMAGSTLRSASLADGLRGAGGLCPLPDDRRFLDEPPVIGFGFAAEAYSDFVNFLW